MRGQIITQVNRLEILMRINMKKIITQLLTFLMSILLSCPVSATQTLTVLLDWFPNPDHAPLIIAKQQGFFKEQGLDVELISPADPNDAPKLVAANKANIGITYQPELMEQVDQGLPLVRIGTLINKPLSCLVVLKASGIKTLADMKGKRIGSSSSALSDMILKIMLKKVGVADTEVELINVRYNLTQALLSQRVDAVTGVMRNYEVPILKSHHQAVITFFPEEYGIPVYSELVFIAHTQQVSDKRFPLFLNAIKKAVRYLREHPEETWEAFAKLYPESNNQVNHDAWFATQPYFAENPAEFDKKEWMQFAEFMHQHQSIKKIQPIDKYAIRVKE